MEIDDIVDKYRSSSKVTRGLLILLTGVIPGAYLWMEEGESLDIRKSQVETEVGEERSRFEVSRQKIAELPALVSKLTSIEDELIKTKQILPDTIEIDSILGALGNLEKELGVKLVKFTPGQELQPNPQLEYKEMAIDLILRAPFTDTMRFLDRLVHMPNLTHIRNINFGQSTTDVGRPGSSPALETNAKLILFKGL